MMRIFTKTLMLNLLALLVSFSNHAQTTLSAGDIAFTGFHSDGTDQFSFITLTDIESGTVINFTDNGWLSTDALRTGEGTSILTFTTNVSCGTEIHGTVDGTTMSDGSGVIGNLTGTDMNLSASGDQILAYQGTAGSPTFIAAINWNGPNPWDNEDDDSNGSYIPAGLTNGVNAVGHGETDNGEYNCSNTISGSVAAVRTALNTTGNWNLSNSDTGIDVPSGCTYSLSDCDAAPTLQPGDLVITEIMQNPSGSDTGNEWFEVYNATGSEIDLNGFEISDNGTNSHTIGSSVVVPAGGYVVLASGSGAVTGGVDYVYSGISLANGDDEIILTAPDETEIDRVEYDGGLNFPDPDGASMTLDPNNLNATDNDTGSNWCEGSTSFNGGANGTGFGTPGMANDACEIPCDISNVTVEFDDLCEGSDAIFRLRFDVVGGSGQYELVDDNLGTGYGDYLFGGASGNFFVDGTIIGPTTAETLMFSIQEVGAGEGGCRGNYVSVDIATCPIPVVCSGVGDIIITEIMRNPDAISDNDGEYIEIYNTTESPIDINGWTLGDADFDSHTINGSVVVPANGYALLMRNGDTNDNGGLTADYVYGNDISLANSTDEVILECPGTGVIDQVFYSNPAFPSPNGASMNLDLDSFDATANDDGANWCASSMLYETDNAGTPGMMNETCCAPPTAVCNGADLTINLNDGNMIEPSDIDVGSTAECGLFSMTVSPNTFDCTDLGSNTVTLTVVDNNADASSCTAGVQVNGLPCGFTQESINCEEDTYSGFSTTTGEFYLETECSETGYYRPMDSQGFIASDLCGDGEIIAEVTEVEGPGFAGIAMREGTDLSDKLLEIGIDGVSLTRRSLRQSTGGVAFNHLFQTQGKNWLRITRTGNTFAAYHSTDGSNWQAVIVTNISMSSCITVGLYATSTVPGNPFGAVFDNVNILGGGLPLQAPTQGVDIAEAPGHEVELFPNPATNELNVNLQQFIGSPASISIFNVNGQAINRLELDEVYEGVQNIDVHALNNGTYLMRIESAGSVVNKKFVIAGK